ncbi:deoxyhypusine hydroxylase, partial [Perkinsus olseni]
LKKTKDTDAQRSEFNTVDPIGAKARQHATKTEEAARHLMDPKAKLSDRYAAMYQLRAATLPGSVSPDPEALKALARVLREDHSSALMRHELAFVVAQVAFDADKEMTLSSVKALIDSVKDTDEACMVRHESAVALGSVGGDEATKFLREYVQRPVNHNEDEAVVVESCKVALDAINFWSDMTTGTEESTAAVIAA